MVNVLWARASHLLSDNASRRHVQSGHVFLLGLRLLGRLIRGESLASGRAWQRERRRDGGRDRDRVRGEAG